MEEKEPKTKYEKQLRIGRIIAILIMITVTTGIILAWKVLNK